MDKKLLRKKYKMSYYADEIIDENDKDLIKKVISSIIYTAFHGNINEFDSNNTLIASKRFKTLIKETLKIFGEDIEVLDNNHIKKVNLHDIIYTDLLVTMKNIITITMEESVQEYRLEEMVNKCLE